MKTFTVLALLALTITSAVSRPSKNNEGGQGKKYNQNLQILKSWEPGHTYTYQIEGRTLSGMPHLENRWSGVHLKALMTVHAHSKNMLHMRLSQTQQGSVHDTMQNWEESMPTSVKYKPAPSLEQTAELVVTGGRIEAIRVPEKMSLDDENLFKGILGLFQADLTEKSLIHKHNYYNEETGQGVFRKMEIDVSGKCEVLYSVTPLTASMLQAEPRLAPYAQPNQGDDFLRITKQKNYDRCSERVAYHFGVPEEAEWRNATKQYNNFLQRSSNSELVLNKNNYTIYSSVIRSSVAVSPSLYEENKAYVYSKLSAILTNVNNENPEQEDKTPMRDAGTLLFTISKDRPIDSSDSSLSSENFEGDNWATRNEQNERYRRSTDKQNKQKKQKNEKKNQINKYESSDRQTKYTYSSSGSSSQEDSREFIPKMNEASLSFIYMQDEEAKQRAYTPAVVERIAKSIGKQMQNINELPKADILAQFDILVRAIASMNTNQLQQVSRNLEKYQNSENHAEVDTWKVYRDAVAQAGSLPAFQQIKTWIKTKKIQGEEAAAVVAYLPYSIRFPTEEVMNEFFKLAMNPEVRKQNYLNSTILIAATSFINHAHSNHESVKRYYPTHTYGRLADKDYPIVNDQVLPQLRKELYAALEREDSEQAQVYIEALAQLGDKNILDVFTPILEGKVGKSTYLRWKVVLAMKELARQHPHHLRPILYNIYKNTGEDYEVRVAAIHTLMHAQPTALMMQEMARNSNEDPHIHVRSTIQRAIQSAAKLELPRYGSLAKAAKSAEYFLTKEHFGKQHSGKYLDDELVEEVNSGYFQSLSLIGSEDSMLPKYFGHTWEKKLGGRMTPMKIQAATSSVGKMYDLIQAYIEKYFNHEDRSQQKSASPLEEAVKKLNIQRENSPRLEASFFIEMMNQQRLFAFSEEDMKNLPEKILYYQKELEKGISFHNSKVYNTRSVSVMFPLAMGMPFIYKYSEPVWVHLKGNAKSAQQNEPGMEAELHFTYAKATIGSVGVFDTLNKKHASTGIETKFHVNLPIRMKASYQNKKINLSMEPMRPDQEESIAHFSVWPYTSYQDKHSTVAVSHDPSSKILNSQRNQNSFDSEYGHKETGMVFRVQGNTQSYDYDSFSSIFKGQSYFAKVATMFQQKDNAFTNINIKYMGQKSQTKKLSISFAYDSMYSRQETQENEKNSEVNEQSDKTSDSNQRRQSMMRSVSQGVRNAEATVYDLSASFEGPSQKSHYIATFAFANSRVDPKTRAALHMNTNSPNNKYEIDASTQYKQYTLPELNLKKAIENEPKGYFDLMIKYGESDKPKSELRIQSKLQRSKEIRDVLMKLPHYEQCNNEMQNNNRQMQTCRQSIAVANTLDELRATVSYRDLSPSSKAAYRYLYGMIRNYAYRYTHVEPKAQNKDSDNNKDDQLEIYMRHSDFFTRLDATLENDEERVEFRNVPVQLPYRFFIWGNNMVSPVQKLLNNYTHRRYISNCVVDNTKISTFDRRTYNHGLNSEWYVLMKDNYKTNEINRPYFFIAARKPNPRHQEVYISYESIHGERVEIQMQPSETPEAESSGSKPSGKVSINGAQHSLSDSDVVYVPENSQFPLTRAYALPSGEIAVDINDREFQAIYDGERVKIFATGRARNNTRGLCGDYSGEPRDDFKTPKQTIVPSSEEFTAWYKLGNEQERQSLQIQPYQPRRVHYTDIFAHEDNQKPVKRQGSPSSSSSSSSSESSSSENGKSRGQRSSEILTKSYRNQDGPCEVDEQVQYYEKDGQICFTKNPLPACNSRCRGEQLQEMKAMVSCRTTKDPEYRRMKELIRSGQNPEATPSVEHGKWKEMVFQVPTSCVP